MAEHIETVGRLGRLGRLWMGGSDMRVRTTALALSAVLGFAFPVFADNPGGTEFTIDISGAHSIWDPGDDLTDVCESETIQGVLIDICVDLPFTVSPKGKLSGNGSFDFSASGGGVSLTGNATGAVTGTVKTKRSLTQVKLVLAAVGNVTATGIGTCGFKAKSKLKANIDANGDMVGTTSAKACVKCPGIGSGCDEVGDIPIAENVGNGDWTLSFDVTSDAKNKLAGSAMASTVLGNFDFDLKGKYKDKKDEAKLTGKPDEASKGTKVKLKGLQVTGGAIDGVAIKYKIGGGAGEHTQWGPAPRPGHGAARVFLAPDLTLPQWGPAPRPGHGAARVFLAPDLTLP